MVSEDPRAHAPERGVEPKPDPEHPRDDIPVPKAEPGPQPGQVAEGTVDAAAALAPKPENASNDEAPSAVNGEMSSPMDVEEESEAVDTSLPDRSASHPTKTEPSESQDSKKEDGEKKEPALPPLLWNSHQVVVVPDVGDDVASQLYGITWKTNRHWKQPTLQGWLGALRGR